MDYNNRVRVYYPHQTPQSSTNEYFLNSMKNSTSSNQTTTNKAENKNNYQSYNRQQNPITNNLPQNRYNEIKTMTSSQSPTKNYKILQSNYGYYQQNTNTQKNEQKNYNYNTASNSANITYNQYKSSLSSYKTTTSNQNQTSISSSSPATKYIFNSSDLNNQNKKIVYITKVQQPKPKTKELVPVNKMTLRTGVKELHFCEKQQIVLLLTSDSILIANSIYGEITCVIKKLAYPRYVALAKNGKFILAHYSDNSVTIMDLNGRQISNVVGVPRASSIFLISKNCRKIMYGSNQQICLWDVQKAQIEVMTRQWKNINCYAISDDGNQFALGTYSGSIFVLTKIGDQKVSQFQIKRHTSCVMCITFHGKNLASVSYDKVYIQTIIETNQKKEKILTYTQHQLNQVPRSLTSCGGKVYFIYLNGLYWLENDKLKGFNQGTWNVIQVKQGKQSRIVFVKYDKAEIEWWEWE